jgi:hypothetical protein
MWVAGIIQGRLCKGRQQRVCQRCGAGLRLAPPKTSHGDRARKNSANWPGVGTLADPNGQVFYNTKKFNNCAYAVGFPIRELASFGRLKILIFSTR